MRSLIWGILGLLASFTAAGAQQLSIDAGPCLDKQAFERLACLNGQIDRAQGKPQAAPVATSPDILELRHSVFKSVRVIPAGMIDFKGANLIPAQMKVYCAEGGYAVALMHDAVVPLNGFSASYRHDGGTARLSDGRSLAITSTDRRDLEKAGIVQRQAEPLVYNEIFSQGLAMARKRCPF